MERLPFGKLFDRKISRPLQGRRRWQYCRAKGGGDLSLRAHEVSEAIS